MEDKKPHPLMKFFFPLIAILAIIVAFYLSSLNKPVEEEPVDNGGGITEVVDDAPAAPDQ